MLRYCFGGLFGAEAHLSDCFFNWFTHDLSSQHAQLFHRCLYHLALAHTFAFCSLQQLNLCQSTASPYLSYDHFSFPSHATVWIWVEDHVHVLSVAHFRL